MGTTAFSLLTLLLHVLCYRAESLQSVYSEVQSIELQSSFTGGEITFIGGQGGTYSSLDPFVEGKTIEGIRLWSGESSIKAIRLRLSGEGVDQGHEYGHPAGDYHEFNFALGETITSMTIWGNGAGTRAGWLEFRTNKGGSFSYGMTKWKQQKGYTVNTYSGILAGAFIRSGADIDALGFYFLLPVVSCNLFVEEYDNVLDGSSGISPLTLQEYDSTNPGGYPIQWKFSGEYDSLVTSEWGYTSGVTATVSVSVKAQMPEVVEVNGQFQWQYAVTGSYKNSIQDKLALRWEQTGTLQPGQSVHLKAVIQIGTIGIGYHGTMQVSLDNGASYSYKLSGVYKGVDVSSVYVYAR